MKSWLNNFRRSESCRAIANRLEDRALWSVHPAEEAFESYTFKRLPQPSASWLEKHTAGCDQCRLQLRQTQLSAHLIKHAFEELGGVSSSSAAPAGGVGSSASVPKCFGHSELAAARNRLPVSHLIASRCLAALRRENADLHEIEAMVSTDPGLAAHLMKVANSALFYSGRQIRSIDRALMQIGFQRTRLHILGLSMRASFASPRLQKLWNHSVGVAETSRLLAELSQAVPGEEACLAGLVHDIGQLVLAGLGRPYEMAFEEMRKRIANLVEIEWRLCGSSHAQIGADLLEDWLFPAEMAEAVRHHHAPSVSGSALTCLVFLAESWSENDEDAYNAIEHSMALHRLGLTSRDLHSLRSGPSSDLDMLRFAA